LSEYVERGAGSEIRKEEDAEVGGLTRLNREETLSDEQAKSEERNTNGLRNENAK